MHRLAPKSGGTTRQIRRRISQQPALSGNLFLPQMGGAAWRSRGAKRPCVTVSSASSSAFSLIWTLLPFQRRDLSIPSSSHRNHGLLYIRISN